MENLFIGKITEVVDKDLYTIKVDIPGYQRGLKAFPKRGEVDEPRVGDVVILQELDPIYKSYYLYSKLKENKFIGIRARGKVLQMNEQEVVIGIFDPEEEYFDDPSDMEGARPATSFIKVDKEGSIIINAEKDLKIDIAGTSTVTLSGDITINADSNITINSNSKAIINGNNIDVNASGQLKISGGGTVRMAGSATPSTTPGPFNCIPTCPFSGAPHASTNISGV